MVLAAVVSLLATAYSRLVPNTHTAPRKIQRFRRGGCLVAARNAPITTRAMAVRPPLMAIPLQGITLMHSPPMLYSTAAMKTNSTPVRRSTSIVSSNPPKRKLGQTENPLPGFPDRGHLMQTRYHLWFARPSRQRASRSSPKLPRGNGRTRPVPYWASFPAVQAAAPRGNFTELPLPLPPNRGLSGQGRALLTSFSSQ